MDKAGEKEQAADAKDSPPAKEGGGKRRMLIAIAGAVLLFGTAGAGVYFSGLLGDEAETHAAADGHEADTAKAAAPAAPPVFYALPDFLVSLNIGERRSMFLKVKISLELENEGDRGRIDQVLPRVVDYCQVYLRELRSEDLRGSAGTARLREELLRRIVAAVDPVPVRDVLFSDLFVQ
jgi:flagellar FliL protein